MATPNRGTKGKTGTKFDISKQKGYDKKRCKKYERKKQTNRQESRKEG